MLQVDNMFITFHLKHEFNIATANIFYMFLHAGNTDSKA